MGTGVADTVVFTVAVETGPTKRFQRSSTSSVRAVVKAAGLATVEPLIAVADVGVGIMVVGRGEVELEVEFWHAASPARSDNEKSESFIAPCVYVAE